MDEKALESEEKLELLAKKLLAVRRMKKAFEQREKQLKAELAEAWGPIRLRSESRIFGNLRLTARKQTKTWFLAEEIGAVLSALGKSDLYHDITEVKVTPKGRDKILKLIEEGELPESIRDLLHEMSFIVWVTEEIK